MPSGKIITAIEHQVDLLGELEQAGFIQALDHGLHKNVWIQCVQGIPPGFSLGAPQAGRTVQNLALQIAELDHVVVGQNQLPDPGGRQVQGRRRAQAPGADDEHPRRKQPLLPLDAQLIEQNVACIAQQPGIVQGIGWHHGTRIMPSGVMR